MFSAGFRCVAGLEGVLACKRKRNTMRESQSDTPNAKAKSSSSKLTSISSKNQSEKNYTPKSKMFTFQFPNSDAERTSADARCRRGRVLCVRIVLYSGSIEGLCERDIRKSKLEKLYAKSNAYFPIFRTATPKERLSMPRRHRGHVLQVRIVVYSEPIEGLCERDLRKSKQGKLYAKVDDLSSNFETATLRERLPMPAVAVAVSFVSVSSSRVGQLKVYMSAIFENQSEETPRQSRVGDIYLPISKQRRSKNFYRCGPSHSRLSIALRCSLCHGSAIGRTVDLGTA
jgi:hypothetical protein